MTSSYDQRTSVNSLTPRTPAGASSILHRSLSSALPGSPADMALRFEHEGWTRAAGRARVRSSRIRSAQSEVCRDPELRALFALHSSDAC
jgi:hypothetical protein